MTRFKGDLHVLCEEGKWGEVKRFVQGVLEPQNHPPVPQYKDWSRQKLQKSLLIQEGAHEWTPLMISCVRAPLDVITLLCHAQPRACLVPDKSGSLPVHFCATFRRGPFVEVLLKILCEASPPSLEVKNAWGQTPLHSLLDAKQLAPIGCLRVLLDQGQYTEEALQVRDELFRLPLHIGVSKNLPTEFLQTLVEHYREACFETDRTGSLPCQVLHAVTQGQASVTSMEALLVPLAIGSTRSRRRSTLGAAKPSTWSQLVSLTKQAAQFYENQPIPPKLPRSLAQDACRVTGMVRMLPLHLASQYGVKLEIIKGICRQYPEGAKTQIPWKGLLEELVDEQHDDAAETLDPDAKRSVGSQSGTHPSTIAEEDEEDDDDPTPEPGSEESEESSLALVNREVQSLVGDSSQEVVESLLVPDETQGKLQSFIEDSSQEVVDSLPVTGETQDEVQCLVGDSSQEVVGSLPVQEETQDEVQSLIGDLSQEFVDSLPVPEETQDELQYLVGDSSQEVVDSLPMSEERQDEVQSLVENSSQEKADSQLVSEGTQDEVQSLIGDPSEEVVDFLPVPEETQDEVHSLVGDPSQEVVDSLPVSEKTQDEAQSLVGDSSHEVVDSLLVSEETPDEGIEPWEEESLGTRNSQESDFLEEDDESEGNKSAEETEAYETQLTPQLPLLCALEIFERGRAFKEASAVIRMHEAGDIDEAKMEDVLTYYSRRSDLLLAYNTDAVNLETGKSYLDNPIRLFRLESQITTEATEKGQAPLSDTVALIWTHLATYSETKNPKKYIRSIGRILTTLGPSGLWKLTVVPQDDRDVFVKIASTGRTIVHEAELRAPVARMEHVLKYYWFQYLLTTYLEPVDALNYSMSCRYARAGGVRLLPQAPLRVTEASWKKAVTATENTPPKPWQRMDVMVTPDCTHTVFVTYYVEARSGEDDSEEGVLGGMLVVRDDNRKLRPNLNEPWGSAVVASCKIPSVSGCLVRMSFPHQAGRSYGLWHFSKGGPGSSLSVSDVRVRQLIHSCDRRGRSPLHSLLSSMVDQPANPKVNMQVSMLLAAKFGSGDSVGDVPLHYALKCGVSEEVLTSIITASPAALVDTDKEGRTPMHAAFLLSKDEPPALGVIRALLTTPGENAIKLKDSSGRLPIHIATERGAGEAILRMLVEAYQDGCYRTNKYGDLPLHLLLKSGTATTTTIELLLRPMMQNESICKIGGSQGTTLPLHIAAEYQCPFKVLEKLLQTYGDAALVSQKNVKSKASEIADDDGEYALDIFERVKISALEENQGQAATSFRVKDVMKSADFALRSDLIFVYNPLLDDPRTGKPYRSDRERIRRLENMIRRETAQCGEDRKINRRAKLSDMARQGWIFLCTYSNPDDPSDNFAGTVRRVLRGMSANAVDVLAHAENPKSVPLPNMLLKDCATPVCQLLIMSRLRFVGRYVLYDEMHPVHKSESCLVMRAKDHGLEDEYKRFMAIYDAKENQVEDDISDAGSEPPQMTDMNEPNEVTLQLFVSFAEKMGVRAETAHEEILNLLKLDNNKDEPPDNPNPTAAGPDSIIPQSPSDDDTFNVEDELSLATKNKDPDDENALQVGKEAFTTFCRAHRLNEKGVRTTVIKFMRDVRQFNHEIEVRESLDLCSTTWPVVPILDHYNVDRIEASRRKDIDIMSLRDDMAEDAISGAPENRDELYALDIQEKNASVHNFALYKYAVVMPAGDRDLGEICQHEELGILQIREYMLQVGTALQSLHDESMIHGDIKMENVVRFGKNLALIDFDGAHSFDAKSLGDRMGGGSSKFCTGVLPPEMVTRIDLVADFPKLTQYEDYWRRVSEDAKDVNLLTPDDIQTISSVTKSLLAKVDIARNLRKTMPRGLRDEMKDLYASLEDRNDWKDILSVSLMTLSFEDLPFSLNRCHEIDDFAKVWNRLLFHAKLWNKVKPRITPDERHAYLIKTHNDVPDEMGSVEKPDNSRVPYALVEPSAKIDVWGFGVLLYALCSGGTLFHLGFDGDLHDSEDYVELFEWNKQKAGRMFRDKVEDPLAQDLMLKILVPEDVRLPDMETVLKHPFFGPSSSIDAQNILERHEEEQLIVEETVVIKRMTTDTRRKIERCMERQCKIIFDEDKVVVPTCLIVVPYKLDQEGNMLVVKSESALGLAVEVGEYLLEINNITAKLSLFLRMKRSLGADKNQSAIFKMKFKSWTKRSKSESPERASIDILKEVGCGKEYTDACVAVLLEGETRALQFLSDPMTTARKSIKTTMDTLMQCYQTTQNLYLVDEMNGVPVRSEDRGNDDFDELVYPLTVDRSTDILKNLLLPFISIAVMKLTAAEGLSALAKLLGLPKSYGVPGSWKSGKVGLVHRPDKPSSIAEFAVLHEVMRRQEQITAPGSFGGLSQKDVAQTGDEMGRLEDFFRDYDPVRTFADLHRVSDGKEGSPAIWTTEAEVTRIQSELGLASAEYKLRELKKEWIKRQKMQEEIQTLTNEVDRLQGKTGMRRKTSANKSGDKAPSRAASTRLKNITTTSPSAEHYNCINSDPSSPVILDPERAAEQRRTTRKKMRFRPYFGVC